MFTIKNQRRNIIFAVSVVAFSAGANNALAQQVTGENFDEYFKSLQNVQQHIAGPAVNNNQKLENRGDTSSGSVATSSKFDHYFEDLQKQQQHLDASGVRVGTVDLASWNKSKKDATEDTANSEQPLVRKEVLDDYLEELQAIQQHINRSIRNDAEGQMADRKNNKKGDKNIES